MPLLGLRFYLLAPNLLCRGRSKIFAGALGFPGNLWCQKIHEDLVLLYTPTWWRWSWCNNRPEIKCRPRLRVRCFFSWGVCLKGVVAATRYLTGRLKYRVSSDWLTNIQPSLAKSFINDS